MTRSRILIACVLLVGCGKVATKNSSPPPDAPGVIVPELCDDPTSVDSCGDSCVACEAASDREVATCDGTACGSACKNAVCSDGSCSRVVWSFDDGTLDGIVPNLPSDLVLTVRDHGGNPALAIDVTDLTEVSFTVPVCLSGTVDVSTLTLSANVMFEGGLFTGEQYYVQMSDPVPESAAYMGQVPLAGNMIVPVSAPLGQSSFSTTTTSVTFQAGTYGAQFSGTLWFDDITIQ